MWRSSLNSHNLSRDGARISLGIDDPDADDEFLDVSTQAMDVASRSVISSGSVMPAGFQTWAHDHSKVIASTFAYGGQGNKTFDVYNDTGTSKLGSLSLTPLLGTQPDLAPDDQQLVFVVPKAGTIYEYGDDHFQGGALYRAKVDLVTLSITDINPILTPTGTENFYYPSFSPDGRFIVFNHATSGDAFYNPTGRVQILEYPPKANAKPIDLPALNEDDGLTNSWPRWSPFAQKYKGKRILWVTFSSNRDYGWHVLNDGVKNCYPPESPTEDQPQVGYDPNAYDNCAQPQIWGAAIVIDENGSASGTDRSFPAFWLPAQDVTSHNHSAQWVEKILGTQDPDASTCGANGADCDGQSPCCSDYVCCAAKCAPTCIH